jgi:hypothetical protein
MDVDDCFFLDEFSGNCFFGCFFFKDGLTRATPLAGRSQVRDLKNNDFSSWKCFSSSFQ